MKKWIQRKLGMFYLSLAFKLYKFVSKHVCKSPMDKYRFHCMVRNRTCKNGKTINKLIERWTKQNDDMDLKYFGCLWQAYDLALLANIVEKEMGIKPEKVEAE